MAHDVFISYSSQDKASADAVCAALEGSGVRCWIAPRDIGPGDQWASIIVDAVDHSRVFVLLFSSGSNRSPQVMREVSRAVSQEVPIIPLRIEPIEPSGDLAYYIGSIHWLDALTPPLEQHIERLVGTVQRLLEGSSASRQVPELGAQPPSVAAGQVAAAAPVALRRPWARWAIPSMVGIVVIAVVLLVVTGTVPWASGSSEPATSGGGKDTREVAGVQPVATVAITWPVPTSQATATVVAAATLTVQDLVITFDPNPVTPRWLDQDSRWEWSYRFTVRNPNDFDVEVVTFGELNQCLDDLDRCKYTGHEFTQWFTECGPGGAVIPADGIACDEGFWYRTYPAPPSGLIGRHAVSFKDASGAVHLSVSEVLTLRPLSAEQQAQEDQMTLDEDRVADTLGTAVAGVYTATRETDGAVVIHIPAGEFIMGSTAGEDDEQPVHPVELSAFWIDQTEVTVGAFRTFVDATEHETLAEWRGWALVYIRDNDKWESVDGADWRHPWGPDSDVEEDHPVVHVAWDDAAAFCEWVGARLPSEAEWEYAARGPQANLYPWGDGYPTCDLAWGARCSEGPAPVGALPGGVSWCGARDLGGNVWEWVADWYAEDYYSQSPTEDPAGPPGGKGRVQRGGSFNTQGLSLGAANRLWLYPDSSYDDVGFRCAGDAE